MNESVEQLHSCSHCGEKFYLQEKGAKKVLCGGDQVCKPPDEKYHAPDCKVYYFCSSECVEKKEQEINTCERVPGWKRFMDNIGKAGTESEIAGARIHQFKKK